MKNVVFLNPPLESYRNIMRNFDCATESKGYYLYQPYDFLVLSSRISSKHNLKFVDCIADKISYSKCFEEINVESLDLIVVSVAQTSFNSDLNFLKKLRSKTKATILVFGDIFFSDHCDEKVLSIVDGIIENPCEIDLDTFLDGHVNGLKNRSSYKGSKLKQPKQIFLKDTKHELFLNKRYSWPFTRHLTYTSIFTAWGCPYSCSYCILSKFPNLWRDYSEVLVEMDKVKSLGIKEIFVADRSFGLPYKNVINLLDGMIDRNYRFKWSTYMHPNQYRPELLEKMRQSGCHTIIVGIENSDLKLLKDFGRHVTDNRLRDMIYHARELGIDVCGDFIFGLPGQSEDEILKSINLSIEMKLDYASFNIATALPGSSLHQSLNSNEKDIVANGSYDSFNINKDISFSELSALRLLELRDYAVKRFYFRPSYILKKLFKINGPEHLLVQFLEFLYILKKSIYKM